MRYYIYLHRKYVDLVKYLVLNSEGGTESSRFINVSRFNVERELNYQVK